MDQAPTTLRDDVTAAFDAAEAASPEVVEAPSVPRDEAGRFAPKEQPDSTVEPGEKTAAPLSSTPTAVENRKAPSTWKKDYHEQFFGLDPKLADYILERESQYANGVSTYKGEVDRYKPMFDAVQPFMEDLQKHNLSPEMWIKNLGTAHQMLVRGSPEQKIQIFRKLANDYGVTFDAIQSGQPDPIMSHLTPLQEELRAVKGQLQTWQEQQQQQQMTALQRELQEFEKTHPHYEAVREQMSGLLQAGVATDLQGAYDKAIRLNDDIWASEQLRQQQEKAEKERQEKAAKVAGARARNVSLPSSTPGNMSGTAPESLRGTIEEAFEAHTSGRV